MNYDNSVDEEWYISVKGTAKAYDLKSEEQIRYHIRKNPNIFEDHIIDLKDITTQKKSVLYFSPKQLKAHGKWIDEFALIELGTLLNSSPITDPIKAWQTQLEVREVVNGSS